MFDQYLQRISVVIGGVTFGSVLGVSFLSGVDPLWAVGRGVGGAVAMLAGFRMASGVILLVMGVPTDVSPSEGNEPRNEAAPAASPATG